MGTKKIAPRAVLHTFHFHGRSVKTTVDTLIEIERNDEKEMNKACLLFVHLRYYSPSFHLFPKKDSFLRCLFVPFNFEIHPND
jgi:hypothetical protein